MGTPDQELIQEIENKAGFTGDALSRSHRLDGNAYKQHLTYNSIMQIYTLQRRALERDQKYDIVQ